jgi:hypothetical protein
MLVGVKDVEGSNQKIGGIYIDQARQEDDSYANVYKVYFEVSEGQKYTDELWLTEKELIKLLSKALELNDSKKQRYTLVKSNYRSGAIWVDREYKDSFGHKMRITSIGNSYKVQWKRDGEKSFKFYSGADSLDEAIKDIETIVDTVSEK